MKEPRKVEQLGLKNLSSEKEDANLRSRTSNFKLREVASPESSFYMGF